MAEVGSDVGLGQQRPVMGMTVAFYDKNRGFAYQGRIPWTIKRDHKHFMNIVTSTVDPTKSNGVMIGRLTYETCSDEDNNNPKTSLVVTTTTMKEVPSNCRSVASSYDEAMEDLMSAVSKGELENIWVLGGGDNYERAINDPRFTVLYVTRIFTEFPVDRYFPEFTHCFHLTSSSEVFTENGISFQFETWKKKL